MTKDPGTVALPIAPRESLSARSALILKRYLLTEHLDPGDRLPPERRLAEALNVSRTVLREALNQLAGEGLIRREASRPPTVTDFDRAQLARDLSLLDDDDAEARDLIELRVLIELGAIEVVVERASEADLREMERWVDVADERVKAGEPLTLPEVRFHTALLRALGNKAVDALLPLIEENLRRNLMVDTHELRGERTRSDERVVREHRMIYEAVRDRDPAKARRRMVAHLEPYLYPDRYLDAEHGPPPVARSRRKDAKR